MAESETSASRDRDVDNFSRDETLVRLETETTTLYSTKLARCIFLWRLTDGKMNSQSYLQLKLIVSAMRWEIMEYM